MLVSIVTPIYNASGTLRQAIDSVVQGPHAGILTASPYDFVDYHIVDGGSTDGSIEIIRASSSLLSSWTSEPDRGMYHGLNKGFQRCRGEVMGWLNSDDYLLPGALQTVVEIFQAFPSIQWITSLTQLAADCEGRICIVKQLPGICSQAIRDGAFLPGIVRNAYGHIQQESTFWRRSLWEACGGSVSEQHGLAGDYELWQRFAQVAEPVGLTVPLGVFRLRAGQASSGKRYLQDIKNVWHYQKMTTPPSTLSRFRNYLRGRVDRRASQGRTLLPQLFRQAWHYRGQRLVRLMPEGPDSQWRLEKHSFL